MLAAAAVAAEFPSPNRIELFDERIDEVGIVDQDAVLEVAFALGLHAHARTGEIRRVVSYLPCREHIVVFACNAHPRSFRIRLSECLWTTRFRTAPPFELVCAKPLLGRLLHPVDFRLRRVAPEIALRRNYLARERLHPLADKIVLPKPPDIVAAIEREEVSEYAIPYTAVVEVYLLRLLEFVSRVSRK